MTKETRRGRIRALSEKVAATHARPTTLDERIRAHVAADDWGSAIRSARRLRDLDPEEKLALERAWEAHARPDFCCQLGRDPEALLEGGKAIVRRRYP